MAQKTKSNEENESGKKENNELDVEKMDQDLKEQIKDLNVKVKPDGSISKWELFKLKLKDIRHRLPIIGKKPVVIAYIMSSNNVKRVKVYETFSNNFFEDNGTKYFLNRKRIVSLNQEKYPVLFYKAGVSEPVNPLPSNEEITFSSELGIAVEGTVIEQFNASDLDLEKINKRMNLNFYLSVINLVLLVTIMWSLVSNNMFIGG